MDAEWWKYENLPSGEPYDWDGAERTDNSYDNLDFHLDIGCGHLKKGRLGIDRFVGPAVDLVIDLETLEPAKVGRGFVFHAPTTRQYDMQGLRGFRAEGPFRAGLPFPTGSIESIISHHALEHIGEGFLRLMDECYRVLKPGGVMRIIVPLFPSLTAVEDPDHKRYFMEGTFETFCGAEDGQHWHESFSQPYTACRFEMVDKDVTERLEDPAGWWGHDDRREIRVALRKYAQEDGNAGVNAGEIQEGWEDHPHDDDGVGRASVAERDPDLAGVAAEA